VALPHCFRGPAEERHAYQLQVLDLATSLIKADENDKQACLTENEKKVAQLEAAVDSSKADMEAANVLAGTKHEEVETKSKEVSEASAEVEAAKKAVEEELKNKETFLTEKAVITAEPEAFQSVLTELWEPLKSSSFTSHQFRKRDKAIAQLVEKLAPLGLEECLLDAVAAALKIRQDKREAFAETAFDFLVKAFDQHQSMLAERVAATSAKEQEHEKAVADAESKRSEMQENLAAREKEHEQLQNEWADLQTSANEAVKSVRDNESGLKEARDEVEHSKADLGSALGVTETFLKMKEQTGTTAADEPSEPVAPDMEVEAAPEVQASMETGETSAVAVVA
jgi:chromosome segregation ATPase